MPTEGALAPDPLARLMPARLEPVRDVPGRRRREPSWKEEVRQRVSRRRAQKMGQELPLFPEAETENALDVELDSAPAAPAPVPAPVASARPTAEEGPRLVWSTPEEGVPAHAPKTLAIDLAEAAPAPRAGRWSLDDEEEVDVAPVAETRSSGDSWVFDPTMEEQPIAEPVERPAQWTDRLQAAAFDLGLLASLWAVVVYFASRAARVSIEGLWVSWPFLVGYLAFLGLVYAVYFTGTCGRTVGKIVCGLKVVDVAGRPPSYSKAMVRAVLGTLGMACGMIGMLPIFFDPARRSLHDRLVRTRVVKY